MSQPTHRHAALMQQYVLPLLLAVLVIGLWQGWTVGGQGGA